MPELHDQKGSDWEEMAKIYKQLTVTVSNRPISKILDRLNELSPFSEATGVHDNGTGPGPIMGKLIKDYGSVLPKSCSLTCSDFAPAMIDQVKKTKEEELQADPESPWNRVEMSVQDAMDLKDVKDDSKSHVTAGWVYFMTPDPQKCLSESKRVLKKDGILGCSSWKGSQWLDIMRLTEKVRPDKEMMKIPEEWESAPAMKGELEKAGFRDVECNEVEVEMTLDGYEPFLDLILNKMPMMQAHIKDFSEDEKKNLREIMLEQTKEFVPNVPGKMKGTALVAVGRK